MRTVDDEILIALNQIKDALKNREPSSGGSGSGEETFEDWKRNKYAFPVTDIVDLNNSTTSSDNMDFMLVHLNPKDNNAFSGILLGLRADDDTVKNMLGISNETWVDGTDFNFAYINYQYVQAAISEFQISSSRFYRELYTHTEGYYTVPDSSFGVAKLLINGESFFTPIVPTDSSSNIPIVS